MKKYKKIVFIGLFLFVILIACKPKPIKFENIISRDSIIGVSELETIMYEIFLAEAAIYKIQLDGGDVNYNSQLYYNGVFSKNEINRKQILGSITYYITTQEIEDIYRNVVSRLRKLESSIEHELENDSIENKVNQN